MLVFSDASRRADPRETLAEIRADLAAADAETGIRRHGLLVAALIGAGELAQGLLDAAFAARGGVDAPDPAGDAAMSLATALARRVVRSWRGGFGGSDDREPALAALALLDRAEDLPAIDIRQPEGFALYAVYPEGYAEAAAGVPSQDGVTAIGIRSVGTTLAAVVAAALDAPCLGTVRPVGHPFRRALSVEDARALAGPAGCTVAVVDEGPGLSGSSVAAVVRHLVAVGVEPGRIHLLPSHRGAPGHEADEAIRAVWAAHPRHVVPFDDLVLRSGRPAHRLERWVADLVGEPIRPLVDISGGAWRRHRYRSEAEWPPALPWQERRKFLLETVAGTWLLRFAGLGRVGFSRTSRAEALAEAGFTPAVLGWRHGFLVERWHGDARSLDLSGSPARRAATLDRIGRYLGFRARTLPVSTGRGASLDALHAMAMHNAGDALGPGATAALARLQPALGAVRHLARPVETDGRMHAWEWLVTDRTLLKTDALDHHAGHDLVGCQDIAWDIAGAAVELDLEDREVEELTERVARESGHPVAPALVAVLTPLYLAFQVGFYVLAEGQHAGTERARLGARARMYSGRLRAWSRSTVRFRTMTSL